jgi:hypothetical protein
VYIAAGLGDDLGVVASRGVFVPGDDRARAELLDRVERPEQEPRPSLPESAR